MPVSERVGRNPPDSFARAQGRHRRTKILATLAFVSLVVAAVLGTSVQIGPRIDRAVGRIEPTLLPTPPSPPQNLAAVGGDGQVSLTWDPPQDDGGSPLLAYLVTVEIPPVGNRSWPE